MLPLLQQLVVVMYTLHTGMSSVLVGDLASCHIPQEDSLVKTTGAQMRAVA